MGVVYEIGDSCNAYNSLQGVFNVAKGDSRPKILYSFRGVLVLTGVPCTLMCSSSKGKRDMVVSKRKQIRSFETLCFLYIKNMFSLFSFNFHIKQPGDLIVFYRRHLRKRTIKIII